MNHYVINTRADLDRLAAIDPAAHAQFLAQLKGACTVETDTAEYPDKYDRSLQSGDDGYVAPNIVQAETAAPAKRYGYTRAELLAL